MIVANGINDAWIKVVTLLGTQGKESQPRGQKSKELLNVSVMIKDPKKRILSLPLRKTSLPFAFGELVWYLSGRNDVEMMSYYSAKMKSFSDDGKTLNSAYGYRMFGHHESIKFNQWDFVVAKLKEDPESRQAIIHLHTPNDKPTKDEVCTLSLQFLIRDGKLDMITNMRSNDIVWGFTYDVFAFTTFQELIANELGIEMGSYYHNAASMHIYEKDYFYIDHTESLYHELIFSTRYDQQFSYDGMRLKSTELQRLFEVEESYRLNTGQTKRYFTNEAMRIMSTVFSAYEDLKKYGAERMTTWLDQKNIYHLMMINYASKAKLENSQMTIFEGCDGSGKTTYIQKNRKSFDTVLVFDNPKNDFNKAIYFYTALMTGNIAIDRSFYSDLVYSKHFKRTPLIDRNEGDINVLETLLRYRGASIVYMDTDPAVCHSRLDDYDKVTFSKKDIESICLSYELNMRLANVGIFKYSDLQKGIIK